MPAKNPITVPLPSDLPTSWKPLDTVPNDGDQAGLPEQYGYNYLMQQVNAAQTALGQVASYYPQLTLEYETGVYVSIGQSIPIQSRRPNTLYGLILDDFNGKE